MPKRITVKHIAKELGISMMTVSRALNDRPNVDEKTKERGIGSVRKDDYIPTILQKVWCKQKHIQLGVVCTGNYALHFP